MAQPNAWSSGLVTAPPGPPTVPPAPPRPGGTDPERGRRRQLLIFGGIAGVILAAGLAVILILTLSSHGNGGPFQEKPKGPPDLRPPLAKACPPPTGNIQSTPTPSTSALPPATGARTDDKIAGISYKAYGAPWEPWIQTWDAGTLHVAYRTGQQFVTEEYSGGEYLASILSGTVPATVNDSLAIDLSCVGHQVAADVRVSYYPQPTTIDPIKEQLTTLGGRPAWLTEFRLHFHAAGLKATDELVGVAVIDVGKPTAAVLYVSIPGTHKQFDYVVDDVLHSVRTG